MNFFRKGRLSRGKDLFLTMKECKEAIKRYKDLEKEHKRPKIKLIPSLRGRSIEKLFNSLNITYKGILVSNPWSYDPRGEPEREFVLGDLKENKLSELVGKNVYEIFFNQLRKKI